MPYTDDTLRIDFENWIKIANPDLAPHQTKYLVADYFISKFHKYQAYLIEQGEGMKKYQVEIPSVESNQIMKMRFECYNQAIEDYQQVIRGK